MLWQIASFALLLLLLLLIFLCWKKLLPGPQEPQSLHPPRYIGPNPLPPLEYLKQDSVEDFLRWVAAVPVSQSQLIRDQVALAAADEAIVDALVEKLFQLPVTDFGRHLLLLSVLGEMRHPQAIEPLIRFLKLSKETMVPPQPAEMGRITGKEREATFLDGSTALQARAAEMLAFLGTPRALQETLKVAADHPSLSVRVAAIDAYLFNQEDSSESIERIREAIHDGDQKYVGLPRRTRDMNVAEFDAQVLAFYERYPEEVPPVLRGGLGISTEPPSEKLRKERGFRD